MNAAGWRSPVQGSCHCVIEALAGWGVGGRGWSRDRRSGQGEGVGKKLIQNKKGFWSVDLIFWRVDRQS